MTPELKTKFTQEELDRLSELVTLTRDKYGEVQIATVWGGVHGEVCGDIRGDIRGHVWGVVWGSVGGSEVRNNPCR